MRASEPALAGTYPGLIRIFTDDMVSCFFYHCGTAPPPIVSPRSYAQTSSRSASTRNVPPEGSRAGLLLHPVEPRHEEVPRSSRNVRHCHDMERTSGPVAGTGPLDRRQIRMDQRHLVQCHLRILVDVRRKQVRRAGRGCSNFRAFGTNGASSAILRKSG